MITKVEVILLEDNHYRVNVTKRFDPQYGGGEQTFQHPQAFSHIHNDLNGAKDMVTLSPTSPDYLPVDWKPIQHSKPVAAEDQQAR